MTPRSPAPCWKTPLKPSSFSMEGQGAETTGLDIAANLVQQARRLLVRVLDAAAVVLAQQQRNGRGVGNHAKALLALAQGLAPRDVAQHHDG